MATKARFRICKVGRRSIWYGSGYPWRFTCRACGRVGHHHSWGCAMRHAKQHDCMPGSMW